MYQLPHGGLPSYPATETRAATGPTAMKIEARSDIVALLYVVLIDVLLVALWEWLVRVVLSSWNAQMIYQERRRMALRTTRVSLFVHEGLTSQPMGRLAAFVSTAVVLLAIAGSFAIDGTTREVEEQVPVLVGAGPDKDLIDYAAHVSDDGTMVSATYLLAVDSVRCYQTNMGQISQYSTHNNVDELKLRRFSPTESGIRNSTCVIQENGYRDSVAVHMMRVPNVDITGCDYRVTWPDPTRLSPAQLEFRGRCPFTGLDAWCVRNNFPVCAVGVRYDGGGAELFGVILVNYTGSREFASLEGASEIGAMGRRKKFPSRSVRSVAHLWSADASSDPFHVMLLSLFALVRGGTVLRAEVFAHETEVDEWFLTGTLGVAVCVVVSVAALAALRPAGGGNGLYSAGDLLRFAAAEAGCSERTVGAIRVGVSKTLPHVGPLAEGETEEDGEESMFFKEEELQGRGKARLSWAACRA